MIASDRPSVITVHTLPVPQPGPRQIVIALQAAGVGGWDESIRDGSWRPAGRSTISARARDGRGWSRRGEGRASEAFSHRGSRVRVRHGNAAGGFYAEYVAVDESKAARVPAPSRRPAGRRRRGDGPDGAAGDRSRAQGPERRDRSRLRRVGRGRHARGAVREAPRRASAGHGVRPRGHHTPSAPRRRCRGRRAERNGRRPAPTVGADGIDAVLALAGGHELERCLDFLRDDGRVAYPQWHRAGAEARRKFRIRAYDAAKSAPVNSRRWRVRSFRQNSRSPLRRSIHSPGQQRRTGGCTVT